MESECGLSPYELRVKRNIEENQRVLKSLGLLNPIVQRKASFKKTVRRSTVNKNRLKLNVTSSASPSLPARRTRRSSLLLKTQESDEFDEVPIATGEENTPPHKKKKLVPEPVFGPIEGVCVGDWWSTRIECSAAGVHRPTVAGIHGKLEEGCYSIALSGGYEDDIDYGQYFTYTGSGGRDLKGTKTNPKNLRTAPQTKDQVLEGPNAALALNIDNHRPVRVIRGYKLPSPYAPEEGYRYDGLYSVERCWTATGLSGFKVYKYALKRLEDQDPPPWVTSEHVESRQGELSEEGKQLEDQDAPPWVTSEHVESRQGELSEEGKQLEDQDTPPWVTSEHVESRQDGLSEERKRLGDQDLPPWVTSEHVEPRQNKLSEEGITCDITTRSLISSSKCSPNFLKNLREDKSNIVIENVSQMLPKRIISCNDLSISPEEIRQGEYPITLKNSIPRTLEDKESNKCSPIVLKTDHMLNNSKISFQGSLQDLEPPTGSPNDASNNVTEGIDKVRVDITLKRTSSNLKLDPERTKEESKNPAEIFILQNILGINENSQVMPKRSRRLSDLKNDNETFQESKTAGSFNFTKNISEKDNDTVKQTDVTLKRKRTLSNSELDPERIKQEPNSPTNSLDSMWEFSVDNDFNESRFKQYVSEVKYIAEKHTQMTTRRKSVSISSELKSEDTKKLKNQGKLQENGVKRLKLNEVESPKTNEINCSNIFFNDQLKHTNHNEKCGNDSSSPIHDCQVQLNTLSDEDIDLFINRFKTKKTNQTSNDRSLRSTEKKVRFTPEVIFNDPKGRKYTEPISNLDCEIKNSARKLNYTIMKCVSVGPIEKYIPQENENDPNRPHCPNPVDNSKKQTSIMKYFEPIRKIDEKRTVSRGILLRSNRRSLVSDASISVCESRRLIGKTVPVENSSTENKNESFQATAKQKSAKSKSTIMSYPDSSIKTASSPVKPCSVSLVRLSPKQYLQYTSAWVQPFLGWDWCIQEMDFQGFDLGEEHHLLFFGFEETSQSVRCFKLIMSVIEKMSLEL